MFAIREKRIELREESLTASKDSKDAPIMSETTRKNNKEEFKCPYKECCPVTQEGLK